MSESKHGTASHMASQSDLLMLGKMFTLFVGFHFQIYQARTIGVDQMYLELRENRSVKTLLDSVYGFTKKWLRIDW